MAAQLRHKVLKSHQSRLRSIDKTFLHIAEVVLAVTAVVVVLTWMTHRPSLYISTIKVEGVHAVDAKSIYDIADRALAGKFLYSINRNNTYLYPASLVEAEIKALSQRIAYTKVSFPDRHTLLANIVEYTPTFLYCRKSEDLRRDASSTENIVPSDCYFADEKGYVFSHAPEYIGYPFVAIIASSSVEGMPLPSPLGTVPVDPKEYETIRSFVDRLSRAGFTTHAITLLERNDIRLSLDTSWTLLWTTTEKPEQSISNLQVLLTAMNGDKKAKGEVREIDLRFGNKIFYK